MLSKFIVVNLKNVGYFIRQARRSGTHQGCVHLFRLFFKTFLDPTTEQEFFFSVCVCVCVHECMCVSMGNINWLHTVRSA